MGDRVKEKMCETICTVYELDKNLQSRERERVVTCQNKMKMHPREDMKLLGG